MRIAIVGSEEKYWNHDQMRQVMEHIKYTLSQDDVTLVSGGCHKGGPDIWAEAIAVALGVDSMIFLPDEYVWSISGTHGRKGFKERNIEIAESCDELHCYDPVERGWSGAMWTAKYADELGKQVYYHKY